MERFVRTLGRLADEFGEPDGEWVRLTHYFRQVYRASNISCVVCVRAVVDSDPLHAKRRLDIFIRASPCESTPE
jgi:hypothetical protein